VAVGAKSGGVPPHWTATDDRPGVAYIGDLSARSADRIADRVLAEESADVAVISLHWGSNWGYDVDADQVRFAHRLIDAGVDVVYGHSSHHPRPIEVYRGRLILYGCGDLVNDYEGIQPFRAFRDELRLMYFASLDPGGELAELRMVPMRARRMRLERARREDSEWLRATVERASERFGTRIDGQPDGTLLLREIVRPADIHGVPVVMTVPGGANDRGRELRCGRQPAAGTPTLRDRVGVAAFEESHHGAFFDHVAGCHHQRDVRLIEHWKHVAQSLLACPLAGGDRSVAGQGGCASVEVRQMAGDEDDSPAFRHQRKRQPNQPHLRVAVEPHRVAGVGAGLQSAGCIEHQRIQTTEPACDVIEHRGHCPLVGHIGSNSVSASASCPHRRDNFVGALGLLAVVHDQVTLRARKLRGDFGSDAARGASDQVDPGHDP
jgi:Bacterial capsule synthesis protein PGA_cap